jgi:hypothetical protein
MERNRMMSGTSRIRYRWRVPLVIVLMLAVGTSIASAPASPVAPQAERETFSALARHIGTGPGGQTNFQITITRWTTPEQRESLLRTLAEEGSDELIRALQSQEETGFVRVPSAAGRVSGTGSDRLRYAWQTREGNQRRIILVADQQLAPFIISGAPRVRGHQFTIIDLRLDENDTGEGTMWGTARLGFDEEANTITIESLSSQPFQLTNVRKSQ